MKKILIGLLIVFGIGLLIVFEKLGLFSNNSYSNPVVPNTSSQAPETQNGSPMGNGMTNMPMHNATYKDGSYTGSVADAFYGPYQVKAIILGGKISDIQFLQTPNDRGNSVFINQQASPLLKQEAISSQNANVDIVSGATQSSIAFRQSLESALSQAQ